MLSAARPVSTPPVAVARDVSASVPAAVYTAASAACRVTVNRPLMVVLPVSAA